MLSLSLEEYQNFKSTARQELLDAPTSQELVGRILSCLKGELRLHNCQYISGQLQKSVQERVASGVNVGHSSQTAGRLINMRWQRLNP